MATPTFPLTEAQMDVLREQMLSGVFLEVLGIPWGHLRRRATQLVELEREGARMSDDGCPHEPIAQPRLNSTTIRCNSRDVSFCW